MTAETATPSPSQLDELQRLRDILYGDQTRATEERIAALEKRLAALEKQLSKMVDELSDEKVSRDALGEMLIEIGQRLQSS